MLTLLFFLLLVAQLSLIIKDIEVVGDVFQLVCIFCLSMAASSPSKCL